MTGHGDDGIGALRREGSTYDLLKRVVPNLHASNLEPLSTGEGTGMRGGIDCTKPAPPAVFEQRSFIATDLMDGIHPDDYLGSPGKEAQP
ncbi:MAG: hypothetical protein GEU73_04560 [Chloroflexi bacterium]|nr:hypothetical protein [Chloroflexota bacterium]